MRSKGVDKNHLAQERFQWLAFMNRTVSFRVLYVAGNVFTA
jgi:hypothetical protein